MAATPGGTIIVWPGGQVRLRGRDAASFIPHVLPLLCGGDASRLDAGLARRLIDLGIAERGETPGETAVPDAPASVAFTDLRDLELEPALNLVRAAHRRGAAALWLWNHENRTVIGPLTLPHETACWNCCRVRLQQAALEKKDKCAQSDASVEAAVAQTLFVARTFPHAAAWGCCTIGFGEASELRAVVPLPWCEVCGGASGIRRASWSSVTGSSDIPEEWRILADRTTGVIQRIYLDPMDDAPRPPFTASAALANGIHGEGKGASLADAVRSAAGEGIERYAAGLWNGEELPLAAKSELGAAAFDPRWLVLYDEEQYDSPQFEFARYDEHVAIPWKRGTWLDTGEPVFVPAAAVFMNFPSSPQAYFWQGTSSGLACGSTFMDAVRRALCEAVERDAFMLAWLAGASPPRLRDDGSLPAAARSALLAVEGFGVKTELYVLEPLAGLAIVVCLGIGDGRSWPALTMGLAAHADFDVAAQQAVFEHTHCGWYMRRLMQQGAHERVLKAQDVRSNADHGLYYAHPRRSAALERFRRSAAELSPAQARGQCAREQTLETCIAGLGEAGIRIAAADVTSPDVALAGLRVARVLGTYLQPVHFGYGKHRLQNPRLRALLKGSAAVLEPHPLA